MGKKTPTELPRYLTDRDVYVPTKKGATVVKASIRDPQVITWPLDKEPSRFFAPLNKSAVEQLDRLYQKQLKRHEARIRAGTVVKGTPLGWEPKEIPYENEAEATNVEVEETFLKSRIADLEAKLEALLQSHPTTTEKPPADPVEDNASNTSPVS